MTSISQKCKYLSAIWSIDASRKMLLTNTTSSYSGQDILQVILKDFTISILFRKKEYVNNLSGGKSNQLLHISQQRIKRTYMVCNDKIGINLISSL